MPRVISVKPHAPAKKREIKLDQIKPENFDAIHAELASYAETANALFKLYEGTERDFPGADIYDTSIAIAAFISRRLQPPVHVPDPEPEAPKAPVSDALKTYCVIYQMRYAENDVDTPDIAIVRANSSEEAMALLRRDRGVGPASDNQLVDVEAWELEPNSHNVSHVVRDGSYTNPAVEL